MFWQLGALSAATASSTSAAPISSSRGDVFTTTQYPPIDVANGGREINALNDILGRTVYQHQEEGGTIVVPGHGYVSDEHEVVEYRDMVGDRPRPRPGDDPQGVCQHEGVEADRGLRHAVRLDVRHADAAFGPRMFVADASLTRR